MDNTLLHEKPDSDETHTFRVGERDLIYHINTLEASERPEIESTPDTKANISQEYEYSDIPHGYRSLGLILTDECNLRCSYCFERIITPGRQKRVMSPAMANEAIDLFFSQFQGSDPSILLFGGEPMLWWEHIPDLITHGNEEAFLHKTQIQWIISTNGTVIPPDALHFFSENPVNFSIDIDGDKENHDLLRPFSTGRGSYDAILANYKRLHALKTPNISLRATATPQHPDTLELHRTLSEFNPDNIFVFPSYFESDLMRWDDQSLIKLLDGYTLLAQNTLNLIIQDTYHEIRSFPFLVFLYHLCAREKKRKYCGAYEDLLAVSPDGILYPCFTLDNQEDYRIGDLASGIDPVSQSRWKELCRVEYRTSCKSCWARYLCGGGCISHTILLHGPHGLPVEFECILIRHLAELSVWLYLEILERKPAFFITFISRDRQHLVSP